MNNVPEWQPRSIAPLARCSQSKDGEGVCILDEEESKEEPSEEPEVEEPAEEEQKVAAQDVPEEVEEVKEEPPVIDAE